MTRQEVFDKVVAHSRTMKRRSMSQGKCRYRGPGGAKCFIGALIPDDKYSVTFEGLSSVEGILTAAGIDHADTKFSRELQRIHDNNPPRQWPEKLAAFAKKYDLEMPA